MLRAIPMPIRRRWRLPMLLLAALPAACSPDGLMGAGELPSGVNDPAVTKTPAGAMAAYRGALIQFRQAFGGQRASAGVSVGFAESYIFAASLLSDELQSADIGAPIGTASGSGEGLVDARRLPEYADPNAELQAPYRRVYSALQWTRGQARQALGLLEAYAPDSTALVGHLHSVTGYTEVLLAELFCSGVPLSTLDYDGDYTLQAGSTTQEVLQHAVALFDSALAEADDNARIVNLARVGKGRALLDLGRAAEAAQAVAPVPDGFQYRESYSSTSDPGFDAELSLNFAYIRPGLTWFGTVADREGGNGLDYRSSGDPRTAVSATGGTNQYGVTLFLPSKYSASGDTPIVVADWVEARLIEAEAALQAGDTTTWLATLNHLRATAITPALPDTTDPGTPDARVDLLFRERAFWLFLTGHRQGDLRRLIRQYGRMPDTVYPRGAYPGGTGVYGADVTAPIPAAERAFNPKFTGCKGRGA